MKTLDYARKCLDCANKALELQQTSVATEDDVNKRKLILSPEDNQKLFLNLYELNRTLEWLYRNLEVIKQYI